MKKNQKVKKRERKRKKRGGGVPLRIKIYVQGGGVKKEQGTKKRTGAV